MSETERNHLSQKQKFEIARYLQTVEEKILSERPSWNEVAAWCSEKLDYKVTETNIKALVNAGGCTKWVPRNSHGGIGGIHGSIAVLKERIDTLEGQVCKLHGDLEQCVAENQKLRIGIVALADGLGTTLPASFGAPPKSAKTITVANCKNWC